MLVELQIRNYAIISQLSIQFSEGLNIMTGETGAGKSIIMGALGLVLGNRADTSVLHHEGEKCVVEATFLPEQTDQLKHFFEQEDIDLEQHLIIRREISSNGKSRGFINDTPVNLGQMKQLASQLVDLHQQFDTLELNDSAFQREVLDAVAENGELLAAYGQKFSNWQKTTQILKALKEKQQAALAEKDYKQYLLHELLEAGFKANELEDLEQEQETLENAGELQQAVLAVVYRLSESEEPIVQQLKSMMQQLSSIGRRHKGIEMLNDRLKSVQIELADIAADLQHLGDGLQMDPDRLEKVHQRLDLGNKLMLKHQVADTAGLLALQQKLARDLDGQLEADERIAGLEKELTDLEATLRQLGFGLRAAREAHVLPLAEKINNILKQVGMPNARLQIAVNHLQQPDAYGFDEIVFLFDANNTCRFEPLGKVASGGELSRLMLAIKSVVAGALQWPTLIFDEIDSGISGEAARQVGIILKTLAKHHQLICITHQPQIAARADSHFYIYKEEKNGTLTTSVRKLQEQERVDVIAAMMGGDAKSEHTLKAAREMIK